MVAQWLWDEWHLDAGDSFEAICDAVAASVSPAGPPQTFVLLVDNRPVGTASLVAHDLDERPNLTPWLAGVLVIPEARGRGHVIHLIQAVEVACGEYHLSPTRIGVRKTLAADTGETRDKP